VSNVSCDRASNGRSAKNPAGVGSGSVDIWFMAALVAQQASY